MIHQRIQCRSFARSFPYATQNTSQATPKLSLPDIIPSVVYDSGLIYSAFMNYKSGDKIWYKSSSISAEVDGEGESEGEEEETAAAEKGAGEGKRWWLFRYRKL